MISIAAVKRDFAKLFSVKREINVLIRREPRFFIMSLLFTLRDRDVVGDPCYAATTWLVWFSVAFSQPSFFILCSIMAEAHQVRQARSDQV